MHAIAAFFIAFLALLTESAFLFYGLLFIILWMTYWPFSILWSLLADFVQEIFRIFYNHVSTYLQKMSDRIFKNVNKDKELAAIHTARVAEERASERDTSQPRHRF